MRFSSRRSCTPSELGKSRGQRSALVGRRSTHGAPLRMVSSESAIAAWILDANALKSRGRRSALVGRRSTHGAPLRMVSSEGPFARR